MIADRTGDTRLVQARCTVLYVCMYVCVYVCMNVILPCHQTYCYCYYLFLDDKSGIDRPIFLDNYQCHILFIYLVIIYNKAVLL